MACACAPASLAASATRSQRTSLAGSSRAARARRASAIPFSPRPRRTPATQVTRSAHCSGVRHAVPRRSFEAPSSKAESLIAAVALTRSLRHETRSSTRSQAFSSSFAASAARSSASRARARIATGRKPSGVTAAMASACSRIWSWHPSRSAQRAAIGPLAPLVSASIRISASRARGGTRRGSRRMASASQRRPSAASSSRAGCPAEASRSTPPRAESMAPPPSPWGTVTSSSSNAWVQRVASRAATPTRLASSCTARRSSRSAWFCIPGPASTSARSRCARPFLWARSSDRCSQGIGLWSWALHAAMAPTSGK